MVVPDRIVVWPVERGRFGLDAGFAGITGYEAAAAHHARVLNAGSPATLREELGDTWTVRLGPLGGAEVAHAVSAFLSAHAAGAYA